MINYFNFRKKKKEFLLTNDMGRYIFLQEDEFRYLLEHSCGIDEKCQNRLKDKGFVYTESSNAFSEKVKYEIRDAKNYLFQSTQLHIFIVTTSCNMKCVYCQAQNGQEAAYGFMTKETAKKAVDVALQSPSKNLEFEFQGGEPLLNFEVIKFIVDYSQEKASDRNISYSIVSNITFLNDEMLDYIEYHKIGLSTSIDGHNIIHNKNRPFRNGENTYDIVISSLQRIKKRNLYIGAIQTTTRNSFFYPKEIVDTYVNLGFDNLSVRPLTPLGCANENWAAIGYEPEEFIEFYRKVFDYLIEVNKNGYRIKEGLASIFLKKIIDGIAMNYMELRSPCGASVGQIAYYYDGNVYTCDEGRMLSEMGNKAFCLGNLETDNYNDFMNSTVSRATCASSIMESLPSCSDCVYQPYCGVCPVVNYALNKDIYEREPNGYRCKIYQGILDVIFEKLQENNMQLNQIFMSWIR